jgi:phenylpropionate dioxygenase-like ring-hydroxylating dioxygenase large terminal subunit
MNKHSTPLPGLSAEELARVSGALKDAWTLPPAAYTDPDLYALEVERIQRKSWMPVGRVDQVPKPGDYICLTLFDQPVMLVRGTDGEVRVMSRVCLHRAAPIAEGTGNRKLFSCPYHAWSYATDGQLIRAPMMEGAEGFDEKDCKLPELRTEIWEGFVMVNLDDEAAPFAPQVAAYQSTFANYKLDEMVILKTLEFDSPWNWKVLVENFMEAYHHIAIHKDTLEPAYPAKDSKIPDADGPYSILHMPAPEPHPENSDGLPMIEGLEEWQKNDLIATVLFPHFLLAFQGTSATWYQVMPSASDRLLLKIHFLVPKASADLPNIDEIAEGAGALLSIIHHEDIAANDMVWDGLNAPLTSQGRLSPFERGIWQLNQWWLGEMVKA